MKTTIVEWDDSIAVRCFSKCPDYVPGKGQPFYKTKTKADVPVVDNQKKKVDDVGPKVKDPWYDFQEALANALK